MDIVLNLLPEIITFLVAVGIAVARTTDTKIDDKVAKLVKNNRSQLTSAVRTLVDDRDKEKANR